jgi:hypothetical protein
MDWNRYKRGWSRRELFSVILLLLAIIGLAALAIGLSGCIQSERTSTGSERHRRTFQEDGTQGGMAYTKSGTETIEIEREAKVETKTGLDEAAVARLVTSAVSAAMKGTTGFSGSDIAAGVGGVTTAVAGVFAALKAREASMHKKDSDEGWDLAAQRASTAPKAS